MRLFQILIFYVFGCVALLTSCATRPYVAIENKSDKELRLELVLDSLDPKEIIAQVINTGNYQHYAANDNVNRNRCDSIKKTLTELDITHYFQDSLTLNVLLRAIPAFHYEGFSGRMQLYPADISERDYNNGKFNAGFDQPLSDYYHFDSTLVNKIKNDKTITLFLPPGFVYANRCHASGDASCGVEDAFPEVNKLIVVIARDNTIILTRQNFKHILKNKKLRGQSDSYVFDIE